MTAAEVELQRFLDKFTTSVAASGKQAIDWMRLRYPAANILVYDNYNALAAGFCAPGAKPSQALFSIALYPRWVSLFFLRGVSLQDPQGRLRGSGNQVRHVVLEEGVATLESVTDLLDQAVAQSGADLVTGPPGQVVIQSISPKQRPRRPSGQE